MLFIDAKDKFLVYQEAKGNSTRTLEIHMSSG